MKKHEGRRGRPAGKEFPAARTLLLTNEDNDALDGLARTWGCSAAAAVRRLIREKAAEMGRTPAGGTPDRPVTASARRERRRVDRETLRRAAEQAREYYATDPEAREWAEFAGDTLDYSTPAVNPSPDE
jgi:plasmid stabilization system protein ParE